MFKRAFKYSALILLGTSIASLAATQAAFAFTCQPSTMCFFQNTDYTGTYQVYSGSQIEANIGQWRQIPTNTKGSVNNQTLYYITVYAKDTGQHYTFGGGRHALSNKYGYWCTGEWTQTACDSHLP